MLFVRSLLFNIGSNILLITIVIFALFTFFIPLKYRYKLISQWAKFCVWWLKITCNLSFKIIGLENIPQEACVVISNHQSTWDTLIYQTILPHQTWVLKKQLLHIPIFGWGLALLNPITIDRGDKIRAIRQVIKQGVARLKDNIWVIIYPEGTRQPYGKLAKYQSGGVAIAQKAQANILPIYNNSGKFWIKGKFVKKPGEVIVVIGEVINSQEKPSLISENIRNWTLEMSKKYG